MHKCPEGTHHRFSSGGVAYGGQYFVLCAFCVFFKSYFCDRKKISCYKNVFSCLRNHLSDNTLCKMECPGPTTRPEKRHPCLTWIIAWLDTSGIQNHDAWSCRKLPRLRVWPGALTKPFRKQPVWKSKNQNHVWVRTRETRKPAISQRVI